MMLTDKTVGTGRLAKHWPRLLIAVLAILLYANTFDAPLVFDDEEYILKNPAVQDFRFYFDHDLSERGINQGWLLQNFRTRKVAIFTFALNNWLHGLWLPGYHGINTLIHLINGLLVYGLVLLTFRTPFFNKDETGDSWRASRLPALYTALFFIAHPVQTQAVTYLSQRITSLATLFYLLSLLCYVRWRLYRTAEEQTPAPYPAASGTALRRRSCYWLTFAATIAAMLTKEISFTLPLIIILYEIFFFGRPSWRRLGALLPFAATMAIIPLTVLGEGAQYEDIQRLTAGSPATDAPGDPRLTYLFTQFRVIVTYLRLFLLPLGQNLDYDYPLSTGFFQAPVLLSFALLCLLAGIAAYLFVRSRTGQSGVSPWLRLISFGICWFFVTLAIESSILPLLDVIFEHRLYLPSVGLLLAMLGAMALAWQPLNRKQRQTGMALLLVLLCAFSLATISRNNLWHDPVTLWKDAVEKSPAKSRPHHNLGDEYRIRGQFNDAIREYEKASELAVSIDDAALPSEGLEEIYSTQKNYPLLQKYYDSRLALLQKSLQQDANNPILLNNIGNLYIKMHRFNEAEQLFRKAIGIKGDFAQFHRNLGKLYLAQNNLEDALRALREAVRLDPDNGICLEDLGDVLEAKGENAEALAAYLSAQQKNPRSKATFIRIASLHSRMGNNAEAEKVLRRETEERGTDPLTHIELGLFYLSFNRLAEAEEAFLHALKVNDRIALLHMNLGSLYLRQGDLDKASQYLGKAERLDQYLPDTYYNLALLAMARKEYAKAAASLRRVLDLTPDDLEAKEKLELCLQLLRKHATK